MYPHYSPLSNLDLAQHEGPLNKTLNIIGCGKVGMVLARLWTHNKMLSVQDVLTRSFDSAMQATDFIGAGRALQTWSDMQPANIYMIATPDDQITACCDHLAKTGQLKEDSIVFHCSGALPSVELRSAKVYGAAVGSVHPIRSFAAPEEMVRKFDGTYCGIEGDRQATVVLEEIFSAIGARLLPIEPDSKILYHSAAVFASNYLVTLLDVAMRTYIKAGISESTALDMLRPLVQETVDNVFQLSPASALTGPIARGDLDTARKQLQALNDWNSEFGTLYKDFIPLTTALAQQRRKQ